MIPPKRISSGPVWVRSDVERFKVEVGGKRAALDAPSEPANKPPVPAEPTGPPADVMLAIGPFQAWLKKHAGRRQVAEVARELGMSDASVRAVMSGRRHRMQLSAIERALTLAANGTTVEQLYPKL